MHDVSPPAINKLLPVTQLVINSKVCPFLNDLGPLSEGERREEAKSWKAGWIPLTPSLHEKITNMQEDAYQAK
jgi:hypothetical protein